MLLGLQFFKMGKGLAHPTNYGTSGRWTISDLRLHKFASEFDIFSFNYPYYYPYNYMLTIYYTIPIVCCQVNSRIMDILIIYR